MTVAISLTVFSFVATVILLYLMLKGSRLLAADIPNHRSLHEVATPRGGGLAFVIATVLAIGFYIVTVEEYPSAAIGLLVVILGSAGIGWLDDHFSLSILLRLAGQVIVAVIAWFYLISPDGVVPGWHWAIIGIFAIVWSINLVNFMDGMDGLAASQGILGAGSLAVWLYLAGGTVEAGFLAIWVAGLLGFLVFNWHPAKVFMGDAGSLSLGAVLSAVSLLAITRYDIPVLAIIIVFSPFLADSGITLMRLPPLFTGDYPAHQGDTTIGQKRAENNNNGQNRDIVPGYCQQ